MTNETKHAGRLGKASGPNSGCMIRTDFSDECVHLKEINAELLEADD